MKENDVIFADELKKDCDIIKDKLSLDQDRIDKIFSSTLENEEKSIPLMKKVITSIVTIVVALLIGLSLMFIIIINRMVDSPDSTFIFIFALLVYIIPAFIFNFGKKTVIAATLAVFGLLLMTVQQSIRSLFNNDPVFFLFMIFCIIIVLIYIFFNSHGLKILLFLFFFNFLSSLITKTFSDYSELWLGLSAMCYISMTINAVFFITAFFLEKNLTPIVNKNHIIPLKYNAAFYFYFYFFVLTFIRPEDSSASYFIQNILYFIFTTSTVILFFKYDIRIMKQIALIFFCAFIFYKYYDLVWLLLHKSLVLIILGILFAGAATIFALRWGVIRKNVQ